MGSGKGQQKRVANITSMLAPSPNKKEIDDFINSQSNHANAKKATKAFHLPKKLLKSIDNKRIQINVDVLNSFLNGKNEFALNNWNEFMSAYLTGTKIHFELDNRGLSHDATLIINKHNKGNHIALHRLDARNFSIISDKEDFTFDIKYSTFRSGVLKTDSIITAHSELHGVKIHANNFNAVGCDSNGANFTTIHSAKNNNTYKIENSNIDNAQFEDMDVFIFDLKTNKLRGKTRIHNNKIGEFVTEGNELSSVVATINNIDLLVDTSNRPDSQTSGIIQSQNNNVKKTSNANSIFASVFGNELKVKENKLHVHKQKPIKTEINF